MADTSPKSFNSKITSSLSFGADAAILYYKLLLKHHLKIFIPANVYWKFSFNFFIESGMSVQLNPMRPLFCAPNSIVFTTSPLELVKVNPTSVELAGKSTTPWISPLSSGLTLLPGTKTEWPRNCAAVATPFGSNFEPILDKLLFISVIPVTVKICTFVQ